MGELTLLPDPDGPLWWLFGDERLLKRVRALPGDNRAEIWVTSASGTEIATKYRLGRNPEAEPFVEDAENILRSQRMSVLSASLTHAMTAGLLKGAHRDPFDRMLVAQAHLEKMPLVTNDKALR